MADVVTQEQPEVVAAAVEAQAQEAAVEAPATAEKKESETLTEKTEEPKTSGSDILKTTAKIDFKNPKNNRKYDPSALEITSDPVKIRQQVSSPD